MGQRNFGHLTEEDLELRAAAFAMILGIAAVIFVVAAVLVGLLLA